MVPQFGEQCRLLASLLQAKPDLQTYIGRKNITSDIDRGVITIECPCFLGGVQKDDEAGRVVVDKNTFRHIAVDSGFDGVVFSGCSKELDLLANAGALPVHVFSDELDLLVDAYLDLEGKNLTGAFQHWTTLRDGRLVIDASAVIPGKTSVNVTICSRTEPTPLTFHVGMPSQSYLNQWRLMIMRIQRQMLEQD